MSDLFRKHIERFIPIEEETFRSLLQFFQTKSTAKKAVLLREGEICTEYYFVLKGLLRKYYVNEKGVEHTTEFALEQWWMCDHFSLLQHRPSEYFIQAVETCELLVINKADMDRLLTAFPIMESYFRAVYQKAYAAAQMRVKYHSEFSREELYHHFRRLQPEFLQRVPQYLIASYLGFTPEYLSEIRKKPFS